jgi:hypothetical protein
MERMMLQISFIDFLPSNGEAYLEAASVRPVQFFFMQLFHCLFQEAAWKSHQWKKGRELGKSKKPRRKFHFKQIAR